jgi:hypothetical protein
MSQTAPQKGRTDRVTEDRHRPRIKNSLKKAVPRRHAAAAGLADGEEEEEERKRREED